MKTLLATIATIAFSVVALPEKAEARSCHTGSSYTYVSGRTSCGCPIYTRRVITGYDCYRRPIYRYYSVPVTHRCRSSYRSSYYRNGCFTDRNHSYRSYYGSRSRSSYNFRTRFGNVRICR